MFKANGGFTLVELIVVIAILAILAGISIPVYANYAADANREAAEFEAAASIEASQVASIWELVDEYVTTAPAGDNG